MTIPKANSKGQPLTERPAWKALEDHYQKIRNVHLRSLFADDPQRGERLWRRPLVSISTTPRTASRMRRSGCSSTRRGVRPA